MLGILEAVAAIILFVVVLWFVIVLLFVMIPLFIGAGGGWLMQNGYPALGILVILIAISVGAAMYSGEGGTHISGWFKSD